ncbi:MAG: hypothetical protein Ct9H90mP22_0220 [Gammaproteobacteria bacterium]|nr:MAG: hypothetical protein Ct9H90mP22_0220 [Gammaproteobacteria bacterium]
MIIVPIAQADFEIVEILKNQRGVLRALEVQV